MSTPRPATAGKRSAANVSTPTHLGQSSPAPRSVPSPAAARQPAGKTPINHPTNSSSQGSKTLAGTPMHRTTSNQPALGSSGTAASPLGGPNYANTPTGLGIEGATPAGLNLATPLGAAAMIPSMSELGLSSTGATLPGRPRNEDEERRVKMRKVLKRIGRPKGRVSEEGIARIARRVGFANDIDAEKLTAEERERKVGNRVISSAGNTIVMDYDLQAHVPRSVSVMFSGSADFGEQGERAGKTLLGDLRQGGDGGIGATLDRFAVDLERLAKLDRLSANGVNCFDALTGVCNSLSRLHRQETRQLQEGDPKLSEMEARSKATRMKSGRPDSHAYGRLGYELAYWEDSELASPSIADTDTKMDGVPEAEGADGQGSKDALNNLFTLRMKVESMPANLYPPLRISDTWLPDPLDLLNPASGDAIPWQDPPPTFLPQGGGHAAPGEQKLPDLRFIAELEPPLVMPYQTALNVLASVGAQAPSMMTYPPTYEAVLLDRNAVSTAHPPTSAFTTSTDKSVLSHADGRESPVVHKYDFESAKPDWAFTLKELPFSHPRQLVELLPTLRQWARTGILLRSLLASEQEPTATTTSSADNESATPPIQNGITLDDLLFSPPKTSPTTSKIPIAISFATSPTPTLAFVFPTSAPDARVEHVSLQIHPNGDLSATNVPSDPVRPNHLDDANATGTEAENPPDDDESKLARALDVCGDVSVWLEWLRTRVPAPKV